MSALKLCPTCGSEYPANERFCPRDGTALRTQESDTDLLGSIIADRYHVLAKLGSGGMGQVYLAEHVKMGRKSAVKVMNHRMVNDADAISRFNREASNASRINHPHVAGIYDFGETPDGLIYLAMEFVEGEPLTSLVEQQGALPPARAAEIVRQTGEALAVAHEMGIVHRDLKPDNIMIARNRDGSDNVKVVDFGIAKAANVESQKVTRTGLIVGTPEYMSPEQLSGDPLDGRSDIYSLGLVAFNMLTGRLPFPSETAQESLIMRLTDRPKTLGELHPAVRWSAEVQAVMDRALERDSSQRYRSASEFGRELADAVRQMPAEAAVAPVEVPKPAPAPVVASRDRQPAPPATRVDADVVGAPAFRGGAGSSSTVRLAVAGAVLAAAGIVWVSTRGVVPSAPAAPPERVAAGGAGGASEALGPASSAPISSSSGPDRGATERPTLTGGVPRAKIVGNSTAAPAAVGAADSRIDMGGRIAALLDEAAEDATSSRALEEARTLMSRATPAQVVGLRLVQATAYGLREDTERACPILREIRDRAKGTVYEQKVNVLLESC